MSRWIWIISTAAFVGSAWLCLAVTNVPRVTILTMALWAAGEELVFRRGLLHYGQRLWTPRSALVISTLAFAGIHLTMKGSLGVFIAGLLLGLIYLHARNVVPCIFTHVSYNFFMLVWSNYGFIGLPNGLYIPGKAMMLLQFLATVGLTRILWVKLERDSLSGPPTKMDPHSPTHQS